MADRPLASIVITTHNRPDFAPRAIASALAQTMEDLEVLVVDDGSQPPFQVEVEDERIRVIRRERAGGTSAARNAGLALARGSWITFLDDDDELNPDMLRHSISAAEQDDSPSKVAVMSAVTVFDVHDREVETLTPASLAQGEHFFLERRGACGRASVSLVVPTYLMRQLGGWDEDVDVFHHDDLGLRLNAVASIIALDQSLYRMTEHDQPRVSARGLAIPADMERTLAKHPEAFAHHRDGHALYMSTLSMYHLKAGNWGPAVRWSARAVARDPCQSRVWAYAAAAIAGPHARATLRRTAVAQSLRTRRGRAPSRPIPWWRLNLRRIRKYSRRLLVYPRAVVAWPVAHAAWALIRRRRPTLATAARGPVLLLGVYRDRNACVVARAVAEAVARGWELRLWALDRVHPLLAPHTIGVGAGTRFPLLNALVEDVNLARYDWVVVLDDDVRLRSGSLTTLLSVAEHAGLDLIQPAHSARSHHSFDINVKRPLAVARRTSFVETGPVFAIRRPWVTRTVPFPADHEMGWGIELEWYDLAVQGARLGIVDAVTVQHLEPVGSGYRKDRESARLKRRLRDSGLMALGDIQRTLGVWRPWRAEPDWASRPNPAVTGAKP